MRSFLPRLILPTLCLCAAGCSDDAGENLPEGGLTTGEQTTTGTTTTPSTSETTSGTTSPPTSDPTLEPTTTGPDTETTGTTSTGTTGTTDGTSTTDHTTTTTEPTGDTSTTEPTGDTTGSGDGCDDEVLDDDQVCFIAGSTVATSATPSDIVGGDFDGDGSFDVLVSSAGGNSVAVHLGDGTGALAALISTAVGTNPTRVVAGEFSGDASWDAITANTDDGTVSILIADGAGGFTLTAITVGNQPVDLGLGDLDGANGLDFAVANAGDVNFHTATNDGSGVFSLLGPWTPAGMVAEMTGIALGSVAASGGSVDAFYGGGDFFAATNGAGDGTMSALSQGGTEGTDLARFNAGDLDGNADIDFAATDGTLAHLYAGDGGDGGAGFIASTLGPHVDVSEVVIADVTGEGNGDVIVTDEGADEVIVYAGFGDLTFDEGTTFAVGTDPSGVAVADLNGDGVNDLVVSNRGSGDITILLSNP